MGPGSRRGRPDSPCPGLVRDETLDQVGNHLRATAAQMDEIREKMKAVFRGDVIPALLQKEMAGKRQLVETLSALK